MAQASDPSGNEAASAHESYSFDVHIVELAGEDGPGFGPPAALVAIVAVALLGRRD